MSISIETTQNVIIDYDIASIGDRILAAIVDVFVAISYAILVFLTIAEIDVYPGTAGIILLYLPILFYHLLCEVYLDGQSFGKKAMKIRVVKVDGTEPTLGSYILRWLLRPIDSFFWIGLLLIAIGGKGQRLGDLAAGTTVIKLRPRISLAETLMPEVAEEYSPTYPEVTRLSDHDVAIIRDVWAAGRTQESRATVNALASRVAGVMGVEDVLQSGNPLAIDTFIATVIRDYAYYTQGLDVHVGAHRA